MPLPLMTASMALVVEFYGCMEMGDRNKNPAIIAKLNLHTFIEENGCRIRFHVVTGEMNMLDLKHQTGKTPHSGKYRIFSSIMGSECSR